MASYNTNKAKQTAKKESVKRTYIKKSTNKYYNNNQVKQWKYKPAAVTIKGEGINLAVPSERVTEISIVEDFENAAYPYFKIKMVLEPSSYYAVMKAKNSVEITVNLQRHAYNIDTEKKSSTYNSCFSVTLGTIMTDNTDDMLLSQKKNINKMNYKNTIKNDRNELKETDNEVEFHLFNVETINATKKIVNRILVDATVTDAVATICSDAGIKNVLFGAPDVGKPEGHYPDDVNIILIPPLQALTAIQFIDTYYGLYESGSIIYFGIDTNYIIPYAKPGTVFAEGEKSVITVMVPKTDDTSHSTALGELSNSGGTGTIVADYHTIEIRNDSIADNYVSSSAIVSFDTYTGDYKQESSTAITGTADPFNKLVEDSSFNPYLNSMYTHQTKAASVVMDLTFADVDIRWFTPNKKYKIVFEDSAYSGKYAGEYRLSYASHSFVKDGQELSMSSKCTFKRVD